MGNSEVLFWNVDTQRDFMDTDGKLYAPEAETIKPVLAWLTVFANENNIKVINTADHHYISSRELSKKPDFITTFPEHCMADSTGAEFIRETQPITSYSDIKWNRKYSASELKEIANKSNIVIRKDAFDVFAGNPNTKDLIDIISPKKVFVYGVTTNVCVHFAVMGLSALNIKVYVIEDAIKELPNIPLPYSEWDNTGVQRIRSTNLEKYL